MEKTIISLRSPNLLVLGPTTYRLQQVISVILLCLNRYKEKETTLLICLFYFSPIVDITSDGDLDDDGIPDAEDVDDDNDGVPDALDTDDDNDGIPDHLDDDEDVDYESRYIIVQI